MKKETKVAGLTGRQRRQLRAMGHHLNPVIQIGKEGVTEALVSATGRELLAHELIKVKVLETSPEMPDATVKALAKATGSELAQLLGRTALLYRPHPDEPVISLG